MHLTVPTMLTLMRIALVPVLVLFFYLPYHWSNMACVVIFVLAAITDIADGVIARKTGQTSRFGAFLDGTATANRQSDLSVVKCNRGLRLILGNGKEVTASPKVMAFAPDEGARRFAALRAGTAGLQKKKGSKCRVATTRVPTICSCNIGLGALYIQQIHPGALTDHNSRREVRTQTQMGTNSPRRDEPGEGREGRHNSRRRGRE